MKAPHADTEWLAACRPAMLRFAQLHLSHPEDAEDAVQDTWVAALASGWNAATQQDPRAYLFGILKHKLMDRLRQRYRHTARHDALDADELDALLFDGRGHWRPDAAPAQWPSPESDLTANQFFAVVDLCVNRLPAKAARVFSMKELLECEPDEICATLAISREDYWQCMSRARKQIQLCLGQKWFDDRRPAS